VNTYLKLKLPITRSLSMLRNVYWEKINWNVLYNRGLLNIKLYTAANARPLFALLVVVYPTYFCRILCLLGVLTGRYRTPVYFQRSSIISINENTSMRAGITTADAL